ncbi:hypothetical protein AWV79_28290 [Cupriavidus sp. UYMMa02A]|nr:hypothetical protein AWV79_28290 [Cupriavidus sp. UYMMa02A]
MLGQAAIDVAEVGIADGKVRLDLGGEQQLSFRALQVAALRVEQRQVVVRLGQFGEVLRHLGEGPDRLVLAASLGHGPGTLETGLGIARVGGQHTVEAGNGFVVALAGRGAFGLAHAGVGRARARGRRGRGCQGQRAVLRMGCACSAASTASAVMARRAGARRRVGRVRLIADGSVILRGILAKRHRPYDALRRACAPRHRRERMRVAAIA